MTTATNRNVVKVERDELRARIAELDERLIHPPRSRHEPMTEAGRAEAKARRLEELNIAAERSKLVAELARVEEEVLTAAREALRAKYGPRCVELAEDLRKADAELERRIRELHSAFEVRQSIVEAMGPFAAHVGREKHRIGIQPNEEPRAPNGRWTFGSGSELRRHTENAVKDLGQRDRPRMQIPPRVPPPAKRGLDLLGAVGAVIGLPSHARGPGRH